MEENVALGEQWWWKAPKCIWQGVNIELKDKQGEFSSLFMPMGREEKLDSTENNILYLSSHLIKQKFSHTHRRWGWGEKKFRHLHGLHCDVFVLFHCLTAFRTGMTPSVFQQQAWIIVFFQIPNVMTTTHAEASLWLSHGAHSISIHVVQHFIGALHSVGLLSPKIHAQDAKLVYCDVSTLFSTPL